MHEVISKCKRFGNYDMTVSLTLFLVIAGAAIVSAKAQFTARESKPVRYRASISVKNNPDPTTISWGEPNEGLVVGVAQLRTTLLSPLWPVVDAYLANNGSTPKGVILSSSSFMLQLDGNTYSMGNDGGKGSELRTGQQFGPLTVDCMPFRKVEKLEPYFASVANAPSPALSSGEHSLRLYYTWGAKLVAGPLITFTVHMKPYPVADAVLQIKNDLHNHDSFIRSTAAGRAGQLRLTGARVAVSAAVADINSGVRNSAVRSLGLIGNRSVIPILKSAALNDGNFDVRVSAIESLVKLGEAFDVSWADPIIRSKSGNTFQNAIWLVRRYGGDASIATLIRCLDMKDPSVSNYYNYTLIRQIGACGGPRLTYHHDFDGISTPNQVESNRKVLAAMQDWLRNQEKSK